MLVRVKLGWITFVSGEHCHHQEDFQHCEGAEATPSEASRPSACAWRPLGGPGAAWLPENKQTNKQQNKTKQNKNKNKNKNKKTPFFSILYDFAPLNHVHTYRSVYRNNPITFFFFFFFYEDDIKLQIQVAPGAGIGRGQRALALGL